MADLAVIQTGMITVGVISDTHGLLDRKVVKLFAKVDHILHAGDIGTESVLRDLETIAPVTAVSGNCDCGLSAGEIEVVELGTFKFVLRRLPDGKVSVKPNIFVDSGLSCHQERQGFQTRDHRGLHGRGISG